MPSGDPPASSLIDEIIWQGLLDALDDSDVSVVPIIGPGLILASAAGERRPYYEDLARRLATALRIDPSSLGPEPTVEDVVLRYRKATTDLEFSRPYDALRLLLKNDKAIAPPEEICQLAEITPIRLFLTTAFDDFLERALRAARGDANVERRGYLLRASTANTDDDKRAVKPDIPELRGGDKTFLHYLFGLPKQAGDFAISDEERIEVISSLDTLLGKGGAMKNLGDHLRGAQLLFLGCAVPDHPFRFFLRAIRGAPFYERRNVPTFVADARVAPGSSLVLFLEQNRMRVLPVQPTEFVRELARRWRERKAAAAAALKTGISIRLETPRGPEPRVVLSCPEDQALPDGKADRAAGVLRRWGFDAQVWSWPKASLESVKRAIEDAAAYVALVPPAAQWAQSKERLLAEWAAVDNSQLVTAPERTHLAALAPAAWKDATQQSKARWPRTAQKRREAEPEDIAAGVAVSLVSLGRSRMPRPLEVYIAASAADKDDKALGRMLDELVRHKWMTVRSRRDVLVGMDESERREIVSQARALVLLLSIDLLGDAEELDAVLAENDGTRLIVPIVVRACGWESDPRLSALTVLNDQLSDPTTPLDQWQSADAAWTEAANRLCREALDFFLPPQ